MRNGFSVKHALRWSPLHNGRSFACDPPVLSTHFVKSSSLTSCSNSNVRDRHLDDVESLSDSSNPLVRSDRHKPLLQSLNGPPHCRRDQHLRYMPWRACEPLSCL